LAGVFNLGWLWRVWRLRLGLLQAEGDAALLWLQRDDLQGVLFAEFDSFLWARDLMIG